MIEVEKIDEGNGEVGIDGRFEVVKRSKANWPGSAIFIFAGEKEAISVVAQGGFVKVEGRG